MEYKFHIFTKWYDLNDNDYASDIDDMQEIFIDTGKYINYLSFTYSDIGKLEALYTYCFPKTWYEWVFTKHVSR